MEIYLGIAHIIFGILSNNWLSLLIALCIFGYNLFSKLKKKNSFRLIIDDMSNSLSSTNKVGFEYKIKFVIYILIAIYSLCFAILANFDDEDSYDGLKIFKSSE